MRHRRTGENNQSEGMPNPNWERIEEEQMDTRNFRPFLFLAITGQDVKIIISKLSTRL
jgi:hypothetical protein